MNLAQTGLIRYKCKVCGSPMLAVCLPVDPPIYRYECQNPKCGRKVEERADVTVVEI